MITSAHAVRVGLRASSRNPELAFARTLIDQLSSLLSVLPPLFVLALVFAPADLLEMLRALAALRFAIFGGVLCVLALSLVAGAAFWAGALPLLAADIEVDRRPPPGNFALLAGRGFARVLFASLFGSLLGTLVFAACTLALWVALPLAALHPHAALFAMLAALCTCMIVFGSLLDLLARLWLLRAAAFGEGPARSFASAASLLSARLGQCLIVLVAFFVLEGVAGSVLAGLASAVSGRALFDLRFELLSIAPRLALSLAFAAIFSWLEVGKMGALAAIACDAEGLLGPVEPILDALPAD